MFFKSRLQSALLRFSLVFLFACLANGWAQTSLLCSAAATNLIDRAEGLAEPSGDIVLNCGSGVPGRTVNANLILTYSVPVTNRLVNSGIDAMLAVDIGAGPVAQGITATFISSNTIAFNGINLTVPASGAAIIRITNVRLAVNVAGAGRQISVSISGTSFGLSNPTLAVAAPTTGLLATYSSSGITCIGSLVPTTINFANLIAQGTNFVSTRVTEGFSNAFTVKDASSDSGTRILVRYTNFPAGARIFIPDYVAGSDAAMPTAGGDIGGVASAGSYAPSANGTLLLARVVTPDATGAGSSAIGMPFNFTAGTISEVPLVNGAGIAVYEVIDANSNVQENAQFPTFIGLPPGQIQTPVVATEMVSFGPLNQVSTAMAGLPVPRFTAPAPPSDCQAVGDCTANYFPVLSASSTALQFTFSTGVPVLTQFIQVKNTGGGTLSFAATVSYQGTAGNWLTITNQSSNPNGTTLRLDAQPIGLAPGTYQATVTVNAGAAGMQTIPVTFTIGAPQVSVSVTSVVNAASFQTGAAVPGSLVTIKGGSFAGKTLTVTFDGLAGTVLFSNDSQINVQVPSSLASNSSTMVVVTVDGKSSAPVSVPLAPVNPGIFGVLNQDSSLNTGANPAVSGTIIQIFATGLLSPVSTGPVVVGLDNQGIPTIYSGGAPDGVQQVNAMIPANPRRVGYQGMLTVCGTSPSGQLVCSPAVPLYVQ
jgi:uncharacterized protein (TIGR03437 family)